MNRSFARSVLMGAALALSMASGVGAAEGREEEEKPKGSLASARTEKELGQHEADRVAAELGLVEDPKLARYVSEIGARLVPHAPGYRYGYEFKVVEQGAPNAFALPGGFVFVSRGLLVLSNSETELANVIGHEIAHAGLRHSAAQQRVAGTGLLRSFKQPFLAAYGRDLERTADRVGQRLAAEAGYDPAGLGEFLGGLDQLERFERGRSRIPSFYDTHPTSASRSNDSHVRAGLLEWQAEPGIALGRSDYLARIEGLVVGEAAEQGVFDGQRFLHPDLDFTLRFPDDWTTRNSPRSVGAVAPRRDAWVALEFSGDGSAREAADRWLASEEGLSRIATEEIRMLGRDVVRVSGHAPGGLRFMATFIPWHGSIYRVTGASKQMSRDRAILVQTTRSFRPMTRELRDRVTERRLRIVTTYDGETYPDLVYRTESVWPAPEAAVYNGHKLDRLFAEGERIKIAVEIPYVSEPEWKDEVQLENQPTSDD